MSYYKTITIAEKSMVGILAYKKFKLEQGFPNISYLHTPECSIWRKNNMWWSSDSDQHYKKQVGKDRQCKPPDRYGFKICEMLTQCAGAKDICGAMNCFWRAHIWYTPVNPIKLVHPWKILVHPGATRKRANRAIVPPHNVCKHDGGHVLHLESYFSGLRYLFVKFFSKQLFRIRLCCVI